MVAAQGFADISAFDRRAGWGGRGRFAAVLAPAAAITVGLFFAMNGLIHTDDIQLVEKKPRILLPITPTRTEPPPPLDGRKPVEIVQVDLPPLPPVQNVPTTTDWAPVPVVGQVPAELPKRLEKITMPVVRPIGERIAIPVRDPVLSYPRDMAARGISGTCEVHFSLSTRGLPFDVVAKCSHPGFEKEARRAVSRTEFLPEIRDGQPVESHNVVYPLEFRMQE